MTPWEIVSKEKGVTTGGYMCKQGRAAARLVQIIGRHKARKVSLQLIMDEPPEALQPLDQGQDRGPPVARIRLSHSNDHAWSSGTVDLAVNLEQP